MKKPTVGLIIFLLLGPPIGGLFITIPHAIHEKSAAAFLDATLATYIIGVEPAIFAWLFYFLIYLKIFHEEISYLKSLGGGVISGVFGGALSLLGILYNENPINPYPAVISILLASILAGGLSAVFTEYVTTRVIVSRGNSA